MIKAVATAAEVAAPASGQAPVQPLYLEALTLVERLHRRLLDVIKDEFDRRGRADVNSVQALLLYNIGDKELTAGELRTRGYYLGSNVSYNVKKLVEMGYLHHQRSRVDRRSVRISLTPRARDSRDRRALYREARRGRSSGSAASPPTSSRSSTRRCSPGAVLDRSGPLSPLRPGFRERANDRRRIAGSARRCPQRQARARPTFTDPIGLPREGRFFLRRDKIGSGNGTFRPGASFYPAERGDEES